MYLLFRRECDAFPFCPSHGLEINKTKEEPEKKRREERTHVKPVTTCPSSVKVASKLHQSYPKDLELDRKANFTLQLIN